MRFRAKVFRLIYAGRVAQNAQKMIFSEGVANMKVRRDFVKLLMDAALNCVWFLSAFLQELTERSQINSMLLQRTVCPLEA